MKFGQLIPSEAVADNTAAAQLRGVIRPWTSKRTAKDLVGKTLRRKHWNALTEDPERLGASLFPNDR